MFGRRRGLNRGREGGKNPSCRLLLLHYRSSSTEAAQVNIYYSNSIDISLRIFARAAQTSWIRIIKPWSSVSWHQRNVWVPYPHLPTVSLVETAYNWSDCEERNTIFISEKMSTFVHHDLSFHLSLVRSAFISWPNLKNWISTWMRFCRSFDCLWKN